MAGLRKKLGKVKAPAALRRGNARERCALCEHMGRGECMKHGMAVRPTQLCDDFKAKEKKR